jgi:hypothetical protein
MLWIIRFAVDRRKKEQTADEIAEIHYPVMSRIATTIYSLVGLLDLDARVVLAFDKDSMTLSLGDGLSYQIYIIL